MIKLVTHLGRSLVKAMFLSIVDRFHLIFYSYIMLYMHIMESLKLSNISITNSNPSSSKPEFITSLTCFG